MSKWVPERQRSRYARRRYTVRLFPRFRPRMHAVAKAYGKTIAEYIEWCIMRDERRLRYRPGTAGIGRQMLEEAKRDR